MTGKNNGQKNEKTADSDHDGLSDYEESDIYHTDPHNPDTDGDGMSDGDEILAGMDPNGPGKLADFFIPHEGNGYKPHSLRSNRLVFHALFAVAIKLLLFMFVVSFPLEAWLTPDVILEQSRKIVSLTNKVREGIGLGSLAENATLSQAAFAKAEDMLLHQYFDHVSPAKIGLSSWLSRFRYGYAAAGENLAMGFADASEVVEAWIRSKTHYANIIDPDYKEIGVGVVSGPFESEETTLVAQFFGNPEAAAAKTETASVRRSEPAVAAAAAVKTGGTVAGHEIPAPASAPADTAPPQVDQARTKLTVDASAGPGKLIVEAEAYLSPDTKSGEIYFADKRLELERDESDINRWTARGIIFTDAGQDADAPIVLPVLSAEDYYGNAAPTDISWENVRPNKMRLFDQYLFFKEHQSKALASLFDLTSFYYKALLIFLSISLLLNIFIEIRKQHPHIIFSTLGAMGLLILLIIF